MKDYKEFMKRSRKEIEDFAKTGKTPEQRVKIDIVLKDKDAIKWRTLLEHCDEGKEADLAKVILIKGLSTVTDVFVEIMREKLSKMGKEKRRW